MSLDFFSSLSPVTTTVLAGLFIALPLLYFVFLRDPSNAPPRINILLPLLKGEFNLAEQGPIGLVWYGYKKAGEIFRFSVFHKNITMMIGPGPNKTFFDAKDEVLSQKEVYCFTVPVFGKNVVYDAPLKIFQQQLKFVSRGLTQDNMAAHCANIAREAEDFFAKWPDQGECDLFQKFSELVILTASRCLLGPEIREHVQEEFANWYQQLSDGMSHLSFFWPEAPTKAHHERDVAHKEVVRLFSNVVRERRAREGEGRKFEDFLQVMLDSRYSDGTQLTEAEISGLLLAALFAGQHTSNITSTWMGLEILRNKEKCLPKIMEEQRRVMDKYNGQINLESLAEMEYMYACMKETLRMYPPLVLLMRQALQPVQYGKYVIPAGDIVMTSPSVSHRLPTIYKNPDQFDPDRFDENRPGGPEDKEKYSFVAFGGGRHGCLGERFAFLQVRTIWSVLFRNFEFELVAPHPKINFEAIVVGPTPPCPVRFKRLKEPIGYPKH